MKKLFTLTIIASAFVFHQSSAQIQKGEKMLGANLLFFTSKVTNDNPFVASQDNKVRMLQIAPEFGFGLGKNWIIGVGAGYNTSKQEANYSGGPIQESKGFTA